VAYALSFTAKAGERRFPLPVTLRAAFDLDAKARDVHGKEFWRNEGTGVDQDQYLI